MRETTARSSPSPTRTATWAPDALRKLVRSFADPDVAYVCGRLNVQADDGANKEGALLALRARAARRRVAARLGHRRQRLDLRRAARGLRRGRPALRPRPLVPVPDGAARPARRLRAGGERVREGDADERGRVPAQGADVRALLGDRARGEDAAPPAAALPRRDRLAPAPALRERRCSTSCCSARRSRSSRQGAVYAGRARPAARPARRGGCSASAIARYYVLVTWATVASLVNYLRRGVPATWEAAEGTR